MPQPEQPIKLPSDLGVSVPEGTDNMAIQAYNERIKHFAVNLGHNTLDAAFADPKFHSAIAEAQDHMFDPTGVGEDDRIPESDN